MTAVASLLFHSALASPLCFLEESSIPAAGVLFSFVPAYAYDAKLKHQHSYYNTNGVILNSLVNKPGLFLNIFTTFVENGSY